MPMSSKSESFTATVEIHRVTLTEHPGSGRGDDKTFRDNKEVARVVVRADTLPRLRDKLTAHVALMDD